MPKLNRRSVAAAVAASHIALSLAGLAAWPAAAQSRGELLYTTHCIACHSTAVHWREKKLATDWPSLEAQVRRWQSTASLGWSDADVIEVTRHLNETFYGFPPAQGPARVVAKPGGLQ
ncbi:MAG: cytochrome C [Gammaproteobacteria bacterium]|nr:cytochrome C [Gammaproteobacteria bacterium]MBU1442127.1 cytochrome C [Gammaproteobacteria bacterium]